MIVQMALITAICIAFAIVAAKAADNPKSLGNGIRKIGSGPKGLVQSFTKLFSRNTPKASDIDSSEPIVSEAPCPHCGRLPSEHQETTVNFAKSPIDDYFGAGTQTINGVAWDWERFETTQGFPVSSKLLDWVIGQDKVMDECNLCIDEWVHKLLYLQEDKWYSDWLDPFTAKPVAKQKLTPGPYLLLLGEPGTGKSLIGRALAEKMTEIYQINKIQMFDTLAWKNPVVPANPCISIHPAGEGKRILIKQKLKEKKKTFLNSFLFKALQWLLVGIGLLCLGIAFWFILVSIFAEMGILAAFLNSLPLIIAGAPLLFFGVMLGWFSRLGGTGGGMKGIGGAEQSDAPKILVDNSAKVAQFIDATGHTSSQLFGSIAWDPYQTGGLGTPEHQRVSAGDVHRACLGVLYIDEIKNLHPEEAITLLTVLEDGQLAITMRSQFHGADTSAMAVSTEPIPSMIFLVGAGNFDSINQIHPALMDRIVGYGKVVRMSNDMENTPENRRKYLQFIAQETQRFHMPPFTRDAAIALVDEGRKKSNKRNGLTCKFRPLISIIKTAGTLALNEGKAHVERKHVIEAINEHCKTIQKQLLEHQMQERGKLLEIQPHGKKLGVIYGLAVTQDLFSGEMTGNVLRVKATMMKKGKRQAGYFKVSGIAKDSKFIHDSIDKVRTVILKKYNVDVAQDYCTHIDFSQAYGVDGPSAGVTMTVLLCSLLEGKPIRQDIALTGEINISTTDDIGISAVGGVHEKIKAAESWGFKKVVIPQKNYQHSIEPRDYDLKVVAGKILEDYLKEILDENKNETN